MLTGEGEGLIQKRKTDDGVMCGVETFTHGEGDQQQDGTVTRTGSTRSSG